MKKSIFLSAIAAIAFASCNNNPKVETSDIPVDSTAAAAPVLDTVSNCYSFKNDKMLVSLHTDAVGTNVTGHLSYNYAEKDDNSGTISGEYKGDTLFAEYKFVSEGVESIREVAFVKNGNTLTEGFGEVTEQGGKVTFKNKSTLQYAGSPLTETPCPQP